MINVGFRFSARKLHYNSEKPETRLVNSRDFEAFDFFVVNVYRFLATNS